jgi:hypothetical protein
MANAPKIYVKTASEGTPEVYRGLIGLTLSFIDNEDVAEMPTGEWFGPEYDPNYYIVATEEVVKALEAAGRFITVRNWRDQLRSWQFGPFMRFRREDCEVVA